MTAVSDTVSPVQALYDAVASLIHSTVDPETGHPLDSLLTQLEDAAEPSGGLGSGKGSAQKAPAALEVLSVLAEIDRLTAAGLRASGYLGRLPSLRQDRISVWASYAGQWRVLQPDYLAYASKCVIRWRERAQAIIMPDPQIVETRAQPCPSCDQRTVLVWHPDLEEYVQRPSLYLDKESMTVYCRCCDTQWGSSLWGILRAVLDAS